MTDIEELEGRVLAALDRIADGVARLPDPHGLAAAISPAPAAEDQSGRVAALEAALEEERMATAQLEERVKGLKARQDEAIETLKADVARLRDEAAEAQDASERLRQVNGDLRELSAQMREQMVSGTAEPHLINKAMMAEIEALNATRAADRAEVDAVVTELRALLPDANAGGTH